MFSNLEIGQKVNNKILNNALKDLYYTNYFKNINISLTGETVVIKVKENPIIQQIKINGIKKNKIKENIETITKKIEKYPFIESKINEQVIYLKNMLKSYGYYFVELETSVTNNDNNSVDIIYNFELGKIAKIKKIKFIGDKIYKDSTLRNIIISEEAKFWKFITRNKFLDQARIDLDQKRLLKFYKIEDFTMPKLNLRRP